MAYPKLGPRQRQHHSRRLVITAYSVTINDIQNIARHITKHVVLVVLSCNFNYVAS